MNQRDDQKVLDYLNAENAYTDAVMAHTKELQKKLYDEMLSRIKQDDESVPYKKMATIIIHVMSRKRVPCLLPQKDKMENPEEILLNVNEMAEGHEFSAWVHTTSVPIIS